MIKNKIKESIGEIEVKSIIDPENYPDLNGSVYVTCPYDVRPDFYEMDGDTESYDRTEFDNIAEETGGVVWTDLKNAKIEKGTKLRVIRETTYNDGERVYELTSKDPIYTTRTFGHMSVNTDKNKNPDRISDYKNSFDWYGSVVIKVHSGMRDDEWKLPNLARRIRLNHFKKLGEQIMKEFSDAPYVRDDFDEIFDISMFLEKVVKEIDNTIKNAKINCIGKNAFGAEVWTTFIGRFGIEDNGELNFCDFGRHINVGNFKEGRIYKDGIESLKKLLFSINN